MSLTLAGQVVGHGKVDAKGSFEASFVVTSPLGAHRLVASQKQAKGKSLEYRSILQVSVLDRDNKQ